MVTLQIETLEENKSIAHIIHVLESKKKIVIYRDSNIMIFRENETQKSQ